MTSDNPTRSQEGQFGVVIALGITQTLAWASSTYLPAILATPISNELAIARSTVFGAFSFSLLVMASVGPLIGRTIDHIGGKSVLMLSNVVLALGLVFLGRANSIEALFFAWAVLGAGMGMGLYDAAFAALVRIYGSEARRSITGITLIGGFASTVGWPLSTFLELEVGWRSTCFAWAGLHICLALPINWRWIPIVIRRNEHVSSKSNTAEASAGNSVCERDQDQSSSRRASLLWLAVFFSTTSFVTSAYAAHLPGLLGSMGAGAAGALIAAALLGPAQVAARLVEFFVISKYRVHALITARVATSMHPIAALLLFVVGGGPASAAIFAFLHGAGNGMITIAKGTLPLALFGSTGYGLTQGWLNVGARVMQAAAPFAFGVVMERAGGVAALILSGCVATVSLTALFMIKVSRKAT